MGRARRWLPAGLALALLTGCSSTPEGEASPQVETSTTVAAPATPWDPCTIPDEAIERAGLNVDTKESGVFGRDQNGFKICGWESQPPDSKYYVRIFVGFESLDYIDDPSYFNRLQPVRVGTREGTQYQQVAADASRNCGIAFVSGAELIRATLIADPLLDRPPYDPCTELNTVVTSLDSDLPA